MEKDFKTKKNPEPEMENHCLYCQKYFLPEMAIMGGMHTGCFETNLMVIKWRMPGCNWVVQTEKEFIDCIVGEFDSMIETDDDDYIEVKPVMMKAGIFHHLPDFEGF